MGSRIGIIGGSGLYSLLEKDEKVDVKSDYGKPSGVALGTMAGRNVAFIPRHGPRHTMPPHLVPYRANIDAMGKVDVKRIIATNAVGSLKESYKPGDFVLFDQFFNATSGRQDTFFEGSPVTHVGMAEPYCPEMRRVAAGAAKKLGLHLHETGTVVVINGPRYSTRAESRFFGAMGFETINMTQYPEVALARERAMCYLGIGFVTDYDVGLAGNPKVKPVSTDEVQRTFGRSIEKIKSLITMIIESLPETRSCGCSHALDGAAISP